jgi:hypothetical protein
MNLSGLKNVARTIVDTYECDGEEVNALEEIAQNPTIEHRPMLISIRDQALEQGEMGWGVTLSHYIYAMTNPDFWEGKDIEGIAD